jgi:pimeloyl-ACP methyl ester carboxylesterase
MTLALIHSPLLGSLTWTRTAAALSAHGVLVQLPELHDEPASSLPFWQQHAQSAALTLRAVPLEQPLVLAGHSGAGCLLPAIRQAIGRPVAGYVFVDAGLPADGQSRLATFGDRQESFRQFLASGGRFPDWTTADLLESVPEAALAEQLAADQRPRSLPFWEEPIPVFSGWPDAPAGYLLFTETYRHEADRARAMGWPCRELPGGHFHMLVEPEAVADALLDLTGQWRQAMASALAAD